MQYGQAQSAISEVINELCLYLDNRWAHLLDFDVDGVLAPARMEEYATAIFDAGAPLNTVWGFIDCTIRPTCRPHHLQRTVYNGYEKVYALKYQAIMLPNGLIGHLYGPIEGRHNDNALLAAPTPASRYFQIFGDPAYGLSPLMISPFSGPGEHTREEAACNEAMAAVRIEVEHGFGIVVTKWPFLNGWWKQRVFSSPVGRYYCVGVLLTNALNCLSPNQTSQYFACEPPSVEHD
ncbi:DDE Tnp4 domain-containing protein [Mycena indigotica]|uniref:DDE Tnp4 domain-containing protein n=1 Tax=Mycena indigotica TaxID=2126181 RepID=A0A8H6S4E3_9AGAR|nr:DDE Tnp4 domain-containing protein [Mycena indigotica]KAF7292133.1 DDE Tnp4 domain-containing protein [Mycena indigotica]